MKLRKFRALVNEKGMDDGGDFSFTFEVDQRFYDENGRKSKPFFVDDNGCSRNIDEMLKFKKVEEIFD